jgi:hypothetical protein
MPTFFDSFLALRCFAALAFSILCRNRTGVRFDFETVKQVNCALGRDKKEKLT